MVIGDRDIVTVVPRQYKKYQIIILYSLGFHPAEFIWLFSCYILFAITLQFSLISLANTHFVAFKKRHFYSQFECADFKSEVSCCLQATDFMQFDIFIYF